MDEKKQLAMSIIARRLKKNWTQMDLADRTGYTRQAVSRWESEKSPPPFDTLVQLAKTFDTTLDGLVNIDSMCPQQKIVKDENYSELLPSPQEIDTKVHFSDLLPFLNEELYKEYVSTLSTMRIRLAAQLLGLSNLFEPPVGAANYFEIEMDELQAREVLQEWNNYWAREEEKLKAETGMSYQDVMADMKAEGEAEWRAEQEAEWGAEIDAIREEDETRMNSMGEAIDPSDEDPFELSDFERRLYGSFSGLFASQEDADSFIQKRQNTCNEIEKVHIYFLTQVGIRGIETHKNYLSSGVWISLSDIASHLLSMKVSWRMDKMGITLGMYDL